MVSHWKNDGPDNFSGATNQEYSAKTHGCRNKEITRPGGA
jgi:hypothetical protein